MRIHLSSMLYRYAAMPRIIQIKMMSMVKFLKRSKLVDSLF